MELRDSQQSSATDQDMKILESKCKALVYPLHVTPWPIRMFYFHIPFDFEYIKLHGSNTTYEFCQLSDRECNVLCLLFMIFSSTQTHGCNSLKFLNKEINNYIFLAELDTREFHGQCRHRFHSLHKVPRYKGPLLRVSKEHASILDYNYSEQAKVSMFMIWISHGYVFVIKLINKSKSHIHPHTCNCESLPCPMPLLFICHKYQKDKNFVVESPEIHQLCLKNIYMWISTQASCIQWS